jgi:hypothetical protein
MDASEEIRTKAGAAVFAFPLRGIGCMPCWVVGLWTSHSPPMRRDAVRL